MEILQINKTRSIKNNNNIGTLPERNTNEHQVLLLQIAIYDYNTNTLSLCP